MTDILAVLKWWAHKLTIYMFVSFPENIWEVDWLTCIVWFLRRGWSKAGWWEICTQSMMSIWALWNKTSISVRRKRERSSQRNVRVNLFWFFQNIHFIQNKASRLQLLGAGCRRKDRICNIKNLSWHCRTLHILSAQKLCNWSSKQNAEKSKVLPLFNNQRIWLCKSQPVCNNHLSFFCT